jgi:predicted nicotinamide N-methyase
MLGPRLLLLTLFLFEGFMASSSHEEDGLEEIPFSPVVMQEFQLKFNDSISLTLLQASTAFCVGDEADDTGLGLWGASVALGQYLVNYHPEIIQDKKVMELGCGGAVPSLVACHLGASQVLSTDFRQSTLDHVRYHADQNKCRLGVELIDWEDRSIISSLQPDVILAADVIYGVALVPPLVKTIEKYLAHDGSLVIATRDGRHGIAEFRQLMKKHFVEVGSESHNDTYLPPIPKQLEDDEISRGRWMGNYSIYTYTWRTPNPERS